MIVTEETTGYNTADVETAEPIPGIPAGIYVELKCCDVKLVDEMMTYVPVIFDGWSERVFVNKHHLLMAEKHYYEVQEDGSLELVSTDYYVAPPNRTKADATEAEPTETTPEV